jgi:hypothetical protein
MSGHRDLPLVSEWGGEFAVADQCAAQLQEREMQVGWPFVADAQPFCTAEPSEGALHDVAQDGKGSVTAKPAPDSAAAIEARVWEMVLVTKTISSPASRNRRSAATAPSDGFHDTIRTAAEVKKQV